MLYSGWKTSEYCTIVVHHGGFMVNSPRYKYTEKEIDYFDNCHVDNMSMIEMYDIVDKLGYSGSRNRHIHVYLEEEVIANVTATEEGYEEGTEEGENPDDNGSEEDPNYVANDDSSESENSGSGFEDSENDDGEREGYAHDVPGSIGFEMDLNNNLGGCDVRLNDEDVSEGRELHSASDSDSDDPKNKKKMRVPEFNTDVDMANPQFKKGMIFAGKDILKEAVREYEKYRTDSTYSSRHLKQDVMHDHVNKVSQSKCLRAKNLALEMVVGSHKGQYSMIYDYLNELRISNPGSTTILMLDNRVFMRLYTCLVACKQAVGVDANDSLYPIAYAVVEAENQSAWYWFLLLLATDLEIESNHNITFISDKQKGLMEALAEVFPSATHRTCVRHLYNNFKTSVNFKGKHLKDLLWKATRATYQNEFEDAMAELKAVSNDAFNWLNGNDPSQWSKSHFSSFCKSDMLLNNLSECFNKDKPILTLVEMVRTKIMQKIAMKKEEADKYTGILCPKIQAKVELTIQQSTRCWPTHAGGYNYQVSAGPSNQHAVNLESQTCSCRKWDITGIFSLFILFLLSIYSHFITPMRGPNQWVHDTSCEPVIESKLRRPLGRPKKKRVKEVDEPSNSTARFIKRGAIMYCSKCHKAGHNQRTCNGEVGGNIPVNAPREITNQRAGASVSEPCASLPKLPVRRPTTSSAQTNPFFFYPYSRTSISSNSAASKWYDNQMDANFTGKLQCWSKPVKHSNPKCARRY
ncbi:hypothetical protein GQ457_08G035830 [Hibiscus cannabinus]